MLNPEKRIARSEGIDIPIMYVYLAGRISGNCIDKCLTWRRQIIDHYTNYKEIDTNEFGICQECNGYGHINGCKSNICQKCNGGGITAIMEMTAYPIAFLDALNSKESDSVDALGLTSAIPPNLIYDKDMMSVKRADVVVAYMDDFMEEGLGELLEKNFDCNDGYELESAYNKLVDVILNRRPNYGTISEVSWALLLKKPLILIAGNEKRKKILELHPFMKKASVIVKDVDELLEKKWLQVLYKSISSAIY